MQAIAATPPGRHRHKSKQEVRQNISSRALKTLMAILLAAGTCTAIAANAERTEAYATPAYTQVDNKKIFNEGKYLSLVGEFQDPPFSEADFTCSGGHVARIGKSSSGTDGTGTGVANIYTTSNIWPRLIGSSTGVDGWVFIADASVNSSGTAAQGAYVEMTYNQVGTLHDASTEAYEPKVVDLKVRYTIQRTTQGTPYYHPNYGFNGHPAIQFSECFAYGAFQFGITALDCTYTFIDSATGQIVNLDSIYYTKTSMDKGEGFTISNRLVKPTSSDTGLYVSKGATDVATHPGISANRKYNVIPGTRIYLGAHSALDDDIGFSGAPYTTGADGAWYDYQDTIGHETYYWRSAGFLANMQGLTQLTIRTTASGYEDWTNSFDMPDPDRFANNGIMYQTANFTSITNVRAKVPTKTINGGTETIQGVRIGDVIHYAVSQQVGDFGADSLSAYESLTFEDKLDACMEYVEGSARMVGPDGNEVDASAGSTSYNPASRHLVYRFNNAFLQNSMVYAGGSYTLKFDARVKDQPEKDASQSLSDNNGDGLYTDGTQGRPYDLGGAGQEGRVPNQSTVTINDYPQTTNIVYWEPVSPELTIEKHAVLTGTANAINDYQYLSGDEGNPYSTVHFEGTLQNITDSTFAKNVTVSDTLPEGLELVTGSVKLEGPDGIDGLNINQTAQGWSATIPSLTAWTEVRFSYDCTTKGDGNGHEIINTAHAWATNSRLGTTGAEDAHATDDGEIYINDPNIVVNKSVSASPVKNDDYTRGEEYRVGDEFEYTVTMTNDRLGTYAHDVWLVDEEMPNAFEQVGDITVLGVDYNDQSREFKAPATGSVEMSKYPYTGNSQRGTNSDSVHGETKTVTSTYSIQRQDYAHSNWGWALHVDYLPYNKTVTVTWRVKALSEANGWEVYNQAKATAANQPRDTFLSPEPIVWINTPEFDIDKHVTKTKDAYNVGDNAKYQVELFGLKTPGTLARKTTLQDILMTDGTVINELSAVKVYDQRKNARDIAHKVNLYACGTADDPMLDWHAGERIRYDDGTDQSWHIDISQVYNDEWGYWVCDYDYRYKWQNGELCRIDGERNPVSADGYSDPDKSAQHEVIWDRASHVISDYSYMKVEYETTINDDALENDLMRNDATANSVEGFPVTDEAAITVNGAQLDINKDSIDKGNFTVGDTAEYEITVRNPSKDTTARNVRISDAFTTAKAGAVEIVDGTLALYDNQGSPLQGWDVEYKDNEAGGHIGFTIETHADLHHEEKMTVRYSVKYLTDNGTDRIENKASTWADNAPEVSDVYQTWPNNTEDEHLAISKSSDKQTYADGETGTYALQVTNTGSETLTNVVVHDELDANVLDAAQIVKGSVKVTNDKGHPINAPVTYLQNSEGRVYGLHCETGQSLEPGCTLNVTYEVMLNLRTSGDTKEVVYVHNMAWTSADNTDKTTAENNVVVDASFEPASKVDVSLEKEASRHYANPGETVHYTITATAGSADLHNAKIVDVMEDGLVLDEESIRINVAGRELTEATFSTQIHASDSEEASEGDVASLADPYSSNEENGNGEEMTWLALTDDDDEMKPQSKEGTWNRGVEFQLGTIPAECSATIEYDCTISTHIDGWSELTNTATLTTDEANPLSDTETVFPGDNTAQAVDGPEGILKTLGGIMGKTGDPLAKVLGMFGCAAMFALGLAIYSKCSARKRRI